MNKIFIITGDISGDMHGALLAKSLLKKEPHLQIFGMGGERMKASGIEVLFDLTKFSLMGFVEVVRHIFLFRRVLYQLTAKIKIERPDAVVFIDYPGFNLRLAEKIKPLSIPLIYYIGPQVWAWGKNRIKKIALLFSRMIIILPFEKEIYAREGLPAFFVGHPLLNVVKSTESKEEIGKYFSLGEKCSLVTILPGSRSGEVKTLLPVMVKLAQLIKEKKPETQFVVLAASSLMEREIEKILPPTTLQAAKELRKSGGGLQVTREKKYELLKSSDLVLTASGTATVEIAILERPMIILYKISPLAYPFLKKMVKLPYIGMVNIIAKKKIVPEFVQSKANAERILPTALALLRQKEKREKMIHQLKEVKKSLGNPGAADRAAEIILKSITTDEHG